MYTHTSSDAYSYARYSDGRGERLNGFIKYKLNRYLYISYKYIMIEEKLILCIKYPFKYEDLWITYKIS